MSLLSLLMVCMAVGMVVSSSETVREVLTFREGCEFLRISERTGHHLLRAAKLPHFRVGNQIRFHLADLRDWIRKQTTSKEEN